MSLQDFWDDFFKRKKKKKKGDQWEIEEDGTHPVHEKYTKEGIIKE
ncbi:MAG: hypothetical protein Q8R37_00935 [Nanoarchaeota archaeon]|nr:hypothetical protein [Nanoarchaeota archaeon]